MTKPVYTHTIVEKVSASALIFSLLILSGCAGLQPAGRNVQNIEINSVTDLPPAVQRIYQQTTLDTVHGAKVSRKDNSVTSRSLNYVVGMVPNVPRSIRLDALPAQTNPKLTFVVFNNGSSCTSLPARLASMLSSAVKATLQGAGNPMPPGQVEIHLVAPVTEIYSLTTIRLPKPRIHLSFYFPCIGSGGKAYRQYYLSRTIGTVLHELTHVVFQWRQQGDGTQSTADGAMACFITHLHGLEPIITERLSAWWRAGARIVEAGALASKPPNLEQACHQWNEAMQRLEGGN